MAGDDLAPPEPMGRLKPGTELNGVFVIDSLLATGGMGEVYRGRSIAAGDEVAIKVIRSDLARSDTALALFRKEAAALYKLSHEAIARFFLFSVDPAIKRAYLAMEFVEGRSIEERIEAHGPMSAEDVATFARRVAAGLQVAHENGIIHRDISPDNIILAGDDVRKAKIIDFGIARSTGLGSNTTVIGGGFAGKYNFVSPEQLGLFDGDVRAASDIYSLGLVMAAALRGKPIDMSGSQLEVIRKRQIVPDLSEIESRFLPLLTRMLQPEPSGRPQSMTEVVEWCRRIVEAQPAGGRTVIAPQTRAAPDASERTPPPIEPAAKRSRLKLFGVAALVICSASAGLLFTLPRTGDDEPKANPSTSHPQPPSEQARLGTPDSMRRFIEGYDGGACFKITSTRLKPDAAHIEGIGLSADAFVALDNAFKAAFKIEAEIGFRSVTPSQCAAVTFLGTTRFNPTLAPRIEINVTELRNGETVSGAVSAGRDLSLELLLVAEDGFAQNVTNIVRSSSQRSFDIRMTRPSSASPKPQLLLAVATTKPLPMLLITKPTHADQLFPALASASRELGADIGIAFEYIVVKD